MQSYNMDQKKEAFLEHLKQKYPHHASVIMGHQERLRDQIRSSGHSVTPQSAVGELGEHLSLASLDSLEAMSEGEAPSAFTRGSRSRASLPAVKSNYQTKDRSFGVLYLQYGEETKQIRMPNEVTGADTIKALFVSAFPQHLTMKILESPSVAIYIKDDMRNMYYELTDVRNITSHSCLKVYHKDPAQVFNHNAKANNGEIRVSDRSPTELYHYYYSSCSNQKSSLTQTTFFAFQYCLLLVLNSENPVKKGSPAQNGGHYNIHFSLHIQLQNQDAMKQMLRQAEQEISERFSDTVLRLEDPVHRQRVQVEEERHRYLGMEERVLMQLGELENYVEMLKKESTSAMNNQPVTLKDVEEGAVNLRRVGEALATLKGEFPALQMKMRAVLRVEVEAVRFLKEEPHKMDNMLKRVKALTDTLSGLRRAVEEDKVHSTGPEAEKEMQRILQQTQASLMKAIPDLEVSNHVDSAPFQPSSILPDEVDSPLPVSPLPEAAPQDEPKADKPVQTSLERPQKPTIEKPLRASVDRVQPNPETVSKSPPPPPPRRFYPSGTGLTTGRSGEVIYTTRKESTSEDEEEAPKPKPLRVPPEVKPKPRSPPPVNTSTLQDEEDEGDKIMAELQVFQKCTVKDLLPRYIVDLTPREPSDIEMEPGLSLLYHTKVTDVMCANSPSQFNNSAHMSSHVP
uniref:Si:ch211-207d6.2 n=1 Tax=Cyprinus carpio TaxID=7962 RepID=A0A8C1WZZ8_CYPCA